MGTFGLILMIGGFVGAAWAGVVYLLSMSALLGTKISKKVGTANENTDSYIEQGKSFSNTILKKLIIRLLVGCVGWAMFYFATGHA